MPIITLQVMHETSLPENIPYDSYFPEADVQKGIPETAKEPTEMDFLVDRTDEVTGMHFLVPKNEELTNTNDNAVNEAQDGDSLKMRSDLLEYTTRTDGSIVCKLCGKVLSSRPHWYKHKYRVHNVQSLNTTSLFKCEHCSLFFKSRKGYIGHIASRHSETLQDASPVLTNAQAEALGKRDMSMQSDPVLTEVKKEPDPELSLPKAIVPNHQTVNKNPDTPVKRNIRTKHKIEENINDKDWEEKRSREEKLVADIIARVRRECEAQGSGGSSRRGYSRKTTPLRT